MWQSINQTWRLIRNQWSYQCLYIYWNWVHIKRHVYKLDYQILVQTKLGLHVQVRKCWPFQIIILSYGKSYNHFKYFQRFWWISTFSIWLSVFNYSRKPRTLIVQEIYVWDRDLSVFWKQIFSICIYAICTTRYRMFLFTTLCGHHYDYIQYTIQSNQSCSPKWNVENLFLGLLVRNRDRWTHFREVLINPLESW